MAASKTNSHPGRDIIVIGASAGGLQAIAQIIERLPANLPAAIFVVIHTGPDTPGVLPEILSRRGRLLAAHAREGEPIRHGRIYCAPPDHHLLIEEETVRPFRGPKENGFRPAIDPLFRTAAAAFGARVVGVVLSGALDDGVHGLSRIKNRGGVAIVQNPEEAVVDALPLNAIRYVEVDHIATVEEIAKLLVRLPSQPVPQKVHAMDDEEVIEADISSGVFNILEATNPKHAPSAFTCPECGGSLWELQDGKLTRFRCHVGHVYTVDSLVSNKDAKLEAVLWSALRALEESAALRHRMVERARQGRLSAIAENFERRAREDETRAAMLREFLLPEEQTRTATARTSKRKKTNSKRPRRRRKT